MQRDYWYSVARGPQPLRQPGRVGRNAAQRTLRKLGGRKVATTACRSSSSRGDRARSLLDHVIQAAHGESIYRSARFSAGKLGEAVAGLHVTVLDDGSRPGGMGRAL